MKLLKKSQVRFSPQIQAIEPAEISGSATVPIDFAIISGGGLIATGQTLRAYTDSSGSASATLIAGILPGANVVSVGLGVANPPAPVQFTITGQSPSFVNSTFKGSCNHIYSTSDYPGSALSVLFRMTLLDNNGQPMKGEAVEALVDSFEGISPPAVNVGYFVPSHRVTNQSGEATFAFVIDHNLMPTTNGQFNIKFRTPSFVDAQGIPLNILVTRCSVTNPNTQPRDPVIEYASPDIAGQGQIGVGGVETTHGLRARTSSSGGVITYQIIEGTGGYGSLTEGTGINPIPDSCAFGGVLLNVDSQGHAGVTFVKDQDDDVVLINIGPGSDVFAVGPPESDIALASDPTDEKMVIQPTQSPSSETNKQFVMKFRMPIQYGGTVSGTMSSLDISRAPLDEPLSIVAESLQDLPTTVFEPDVDGRYATFITSQNSPLVAINAHQGDALVNLGSTTGIQAIARGCMQLQMKYTLGQAAGILVDGAIRAVLKPGHIKVVASPGEDVEIFTGMDSKTPDFQWTVEGVNNTTVSSPNWMQSTLHLKFTLAAAPQKQADTAGENKDNPFVVQVPGGDAGRRSAFNVKLRVFNTKDLDPAALLVSNGPSAGFNGAFPANSAALTQQFPFYSQNDPPVDPANPTQETPAPGKFLPITPFWTNAFLVKTGSPDLNINQRLVYTPTNSGTEVAVTSELLILQVDNPANPSTFNFIGGAVMGTAVRPVAKTLFDLVDLTSAVSHHEQVHVQNYLDADINPQNIYRRVALNIANQYFNTNIVPLASRNPQDQAEAKTAALQFLGFLNELDTYYAQLVDALGDGQTSWFMVKSAFSGLAVNWNVTLKRMQPGGGYVLPTSKVVLSVQDPERSELITAFQNKYDTLKQIAVLTSNKKTVTGAFDIFLGGRASLQNMKIPNEQLSANFPRIQRPE